MKPKTMPRATAVRNASAAAVTEKMTVMPNRSAAPAPIPSPMASPTMPPAPESVIASIRNTEFFEVLLPDGAQKYGLVRDIVVGRDGLVHVPQGPGLGALIDFALIERKKIAVLA